MTAVSSSYYTCRLLIVEYTISSLSPLSYLTQRTTTNTGLLELGANSAESSTWQPARSALLVADALMYA